MPHELVDNYAINTHLTHDNLHVIHFQSKFIFNSKYIFLFEHSFALITSLNKLSFIFIGYLHQIYHYRVI